MFQVTVLQIEGAAKTAIEVNKVLNQLRTKVKGRLQPAGILAIKCVFKDNVTRGTSRSAKRIGTRHRKEALPDQRVIHRALVQPD